MITTRIIALATLLSAGCGTRYIYGRTGEVVAAAKPPNCAYVLLDAPPDKPFDELGVLAPNDIEFGDMSGGPTPYKETVGEQVCAAGGDAVVVERDDNGRYVRGTVIKYRAAG